MRSSSSTVILLLIAAGLSLAPASPQAPRATNLADDVYAMYAGGDTRAIEREMASASAALRSDLGDALRRWKSEWSPKRAAFLLEVTVAALDHGWPDPLTLLNSARDFVRDRPDLPGTNADDDVFEVTFHQTAVAVLCEHALAADAEAYIKEIGNRIAEPGATGRALRRRLVAPRLALARAIARDAQARPYLTKATTRANAATRARFTDVMDAFDLAARDPATLEEASVRRAYLLLRVGEPERALKALDQVKASDDAVLRYWRGLVLGRVLTAVGKADDAIKVYEATARIAPHAQSTAVGLAALLLEQGNRDGALVWAERARTTPEDSIDPWWIYWTGETRFLPEWIAELRKARP